MSFSDDIRDAKCRFPQHVKAFEDLFRKHRISSTATAWEALSSGSFREDMVELAEQLMKAEGGKLTFSVAFAIIGAALGGGGVATLPSKRMISRGSNPTFSAITSFDGGHW